MDGLWGLGRVSVKDQGHSAIEAPQVGGLQLNSLLDGKFGYFGAFEGIEEETSHPLNPFSRFPLPSLGSGNPREWSQSVGIISTRENGLNPRGGSQPEGMVST